MTRTADGDQQAAYLVIGDTAVARRVCASLVDATCPSLVRHLVTTEDAELAVALHGQVIGAAILVRDDVVALRCALALAHLEPTLPLVVAIFDKTISGQLRIFLPQASVISPADLAVPSLAGPCINAELLASFVDENRTIVRSGDGGTPTDNRSTRPRRRVINRILGALRSDHRHHDVGTRLLLVGLLGLGIVLFADWCWLVFAENHGFAKAFLEAARVVSTVGPAPTAATSGYAVVAAIGMLATIVLTALFTAGLVDRLLEPQLLALVGSRTAAHKDHVVVVGMGQVGVRLCAHLKALHIPVVGVERDRRAPYLPLARQLGIPVIIGSGTERRLLESLKLDRSRALAAVGSDDLDNIAVAVAAAAVSPSTRVVLRAGEDEAIAETRSLIPLGTIRDVTEIVATYLLAAMLGKKVRAVVAAENRVYLRSTGGAYEPLPVSGKENCRHTTPRGETARRG